MKRRAISLKTKLAATLLQMVRYDEHQAEFVRIISYAESKTMTADQIIARFRFDHGIAHAHGGPDAPWNLTPMPTAAHHIKTIKIDIPRIAKSKRITASQEDFRRKMLAKDSGDTPAPSKWGSRKIQNRNTFERRA